jgi:lycopene beta-cyclase
MALTKHDGLIIAGGGLAGSLLALAMAEKRPDVPVMLIEGGETFGGNHLWSFFDSDVADVDRWLVDPLVSHHWDGHIVAFPDHSRKLRGGYNTIRSDRLDMTVRERLTPAMRITGMKVVEVRDDLVTLLSGDKIKARGVIDARGAANLGYLDLGWQKFVGREYRFDRPHGVTHPVIMDATVDQADGYRFVYLLPFDERTMLVEDTYYGDAPELDIPGVGARIDDYVARRNFGPGAVLREESGCLPVAMDGDFGAFWRVGGARVGKVGLRGGLFHPTTGYTLPDAVRTAVAIAAAPDLSGAALHDLTERMAAKSWKDRGFYRTLDTMLFRAAEPAQRYKILERFYRLDANLIARFYAGQSTMLDKMRVLSGKPPVPIGKAVNALNSRRA